MKIRPQVLIAIIILGIIAMYGINKEVQEISIGATTAIAALSMKLSEAE